MLSLSGVMPGLEPHGRRLMRKDVIDVIREKEQLPDSMTDDEIAREYKVPIRLPGRH